MAQRIGATGTRVGRPPIKKAPIDEFFDAVHGFQNPIRGVSVKPPKAPKPPRQRPAKVGPYTKPVSYKQWVAKGKPANQPVKVGDQTILAGSSGGRVSSVRGPKAVQATRPVSPQSPKLSQRDAERLAGFTHTQGQAIRKRSYAESHASLIPSHADLVTASQALLGPTLTEAIGERSFDPILHHPLAGSLEALGLIPIPGVGKVFRAPEALLEGGKAIRAGETAQDAARAAADVVKHGSRNPANRVLHAGGVAYENPASRGRVLRAAQRVMDQAAQRSINRNPEIQGRFVAPYVQHFVNTARHYTTLTERLPAEILHSYRLSKPERFALEMVAHETSPADWIANNRRLITEGANRADTRRLIGEIGLVRKAIPLVKMIPAGEAHGTFATRLTHGLTPVLSETASPKLHQAFEDMVTAGRLRATMAKDPRLADLLGFHALTDERELARLSGPGRFRLGARWQDHYLAAGSKWAHATDAEIQTHVDDIAKRWGKLVDSIYEDVPGKKAEQAWRNSRAKKLARKGLPRMQTVNEQAQAYAEKKAWNLVSTHPELAHIRDQVQEMEDLKRLLEARAEARAFGEPMPGGPELRPGADVRIDGRYPGKVISVHNGHAEVWMYRAGEGQKPLRLTKLVSSLEEKLPSSLVGAEHFTGGRVYIPSVSVAKKWFQSQARFGGETLPRTVQGGSEFKNPYRGALAAKGMEVHHPTELVANAFSQMQRMNSAVRELEQLRGGAFPEDAISTGLNRYGRPTLAKPGVSARGFVPIRMTKATPLSQESQAALMDMRHPEKLDDLLGGVIGRAAHADPGEIAFVPKALVGDLLRSPASQTEFGRWVKDVSLFVKNLIVYTKFPGHIPPRLMSNLSMAAAQQGAELVPTSIATLKLSHDYPQVARIMDAAMQTRHSFRSFAQEEGHPFMGKVGETLARPVVWSADKAPRRVALAYELSQQAGRRLSVDEMAHYVQRLYTAAPGSADARTWRMVIQRANRAAGDYTRANSVERRIAPFVFLYQWGKVAANITAKSALEHPLRSAALAGSVYKYAYDPGRKPWEQFGIPLSGGRIANLTTALPFTTPHEYAVNAYNLARTVAGGKPQFGEGLGNVLNPLIPTVFGMGLGYDPTTGHASGGALGSLQALGRQTPPGALIAGKKPLDERIGKFLLGNEYPQHLSSSSGASVDPAVFSTRPGSITPAQHARIMRLVQQARRNARRAVARAAVRGAMGKNAYVGQLRKYGVTEAFDHGQLGKGQQKAWERQTQLNEAVANLPRYHNPTPAQKLDYAKRKLNVAIDLAVNTGNWDEANLGSADAYKQAVAKAKVGYTLVSAYNWISRHLLGGAILAEWRQYARTKNPAAFRG